MATPLSALAADLWPLPSLHLLQICGCCGHSTAVCRAQAQAVTPIPTQPNTHGNHKGLVHTRAWDGHPTTPPSDLAPTRVTGAQSNAPHQAVPKSAHARKCHAFAGSTHRSAAAVLRQVFPAAAAGCHPVSDTVWFVNCHTPAAKPSDLSYKATL